MNSRALRDTLDKDGRVLAEGDRVCGAGETGYVTRAAGGSLITIRLDSSGRNLSSSATLWTKLEP